MQSFSMQVDPRQTISSLPTLGSRLHLPQGWKYRVVKPESDLMLEAKGKPWFSKTTCLIPTSGSTEWPSARALNSDSVSHTLPTRSLQDP